MTSYNQIIFEMTRSIDPELAEDLNRRMLHPLTSIVDLVTFFNALISQYPADWAKFWFGPSLNTFEEWCSAYRLSILPFLSMHRLPPAAADIRPMYPL